MAVPLAKDTEASTAKGSTGAQIQLDGLCSLSCKRLVLELPGAAV